MAVQTAQFFATPQGLNVTQERYLEAEYQAFQARRYPAATYPEFLAFYWLETRARYVEFEDFFFQLPLLGGRNGGGFVVDFVVNRDQDPSLVIEVQGIAFHTGDFAFGDPANVLAYDRLRREILEQQGYRVVWVSDVKLQQALDATMRTALNGQDAL